MARLIPQVDWNTIANGGERTVARELVRQLPPGCLVYHSYPWLRMRFNDRSKKRYLEPGEADFIIVDPELGLLVLEVKGGSILFDAHRHEYVRVHADGGQERIQNPFDQAARNLYALRDRILNHEHFKGQNQLPFAHGYAVVWPHCLVTGTLPADSTREILFDSDDLANLGFKARDALRHWSRTTQSRRLDDRMRDAIQESLSPVLHLTPVLWRTLDEQEAKLRHLTRDQEFVLEMLAQHPRAAIEGVAGSGKTVLALGQAQRFARQGRRTLWLCFNRMLADWMQSQLPDHFRDTITVQTFHGLCDDLCRQARIPFETRIHEPEFWTAIAPELLCAAGRVLGSAARFDALVVDEGQDFWPDWWQALETSCGSRSADFPFYVFYDLKQKIFVKEPRLPEGLSGPFILSRNCRNTRCIARLCGSIIHASIEVREETPEGFPPTMLLANSADEVVARTQEQVTHWCQERSGGLTRGRVAVLTPTETAYTWPAQLGKVPWTRQLEDWRADRGVLLTTCRKFKGLEADALVLAGVPRPDRRQFFSTADYYVAASRAKHLLTVIATEPFE